MRIYDVGGSVRDSLMGKTPKDFDYVVTGSTPEQMLSLGYKPVGADFPVFLHPVTGDEYALARKEIKTGTGYHGFTSQHDADVSLEDDLFRRDLTINAMATENGRLFDPYDGENDMNNKVLRHVSNAFADDPVRVLRLARFHARFGPELAIAPETKAMCRDLVASGELENLTAERVWKETENALMEANPELFFETLLEVGALEVVFPEIFALSLAKENLKWHPEGNAFAHTMLVLRHAVKMNEDLEGRLNALMHDLGKGNTPKELMELGKHHGHEIRGIYLGRDMGERFKMPPKMVKRIGMVTRFHMNMHKLPELNPKTFVNMFDAMDAKRDPDVVTRLLQLGDNDEHGRLGSEDTPYNQTHTMLVDAFAVYQSVTFTSVFGEETCKDGEKIKARMRQERLRRMKEWKRNR